jgi:nucleotide-binding universal stress UspA family protein
MSTTTRFVAVGYDGSENAMRAVEVATAEALRRGLALHLVTAVDVFPYDTLIAFHDSGGDSLAATAHAKARLEELADRIRAQQPELVVTTRARGLAPAALLVEESAGADLLVLGEHHGGLLGSLSDSVAAHAACPVLVVRRTAHPDGPVVLGVDGSEVGERAVEFAFEEAQLLGARIEALHTYEPWNYADMPPARTEGDEEESRLLAESLAGWCAKYPDVPVEHALVRDRAATALVEASRHARLVVVGSRGRGGFTGLLLGSVSRTVLHRAACSVAVVRATG